MGQIKLDDIRYAVDDFQFNEDSCNYNAPALLKNVVSESLDNSQHTIHEEDKGTKISKYDMDN